MLTIQIGKEGLKETQFVKVGKSVPPSNKGGSKRYPPKGKGLGRRDRGKRKITGFASEKKKKKKKKNTQRRKV